MTEDLVRHDEGPTARATLVAVAAQLLQEHGPAAVTTRGVARAAGVQAPTIYRLFRDKEGLLDAVAEHVMATYVSTKAAGLPPAADADPVADLREGWDVHIAFGLANSALFRLLNAPDRSHPSPAAAVGLEVLRSRVRRVAAAGRLRVSERRAVELIYAAGTGTVLTLLATPARDRDLQLADAMYDAVAAAILTDVASTEDATAVSAITLRAVAPSLPILSQAEQTLLTEWLDRLIDAAGPPP